MQWQCATAVPFVNKTLHTHPSLCNEEEEDEGHGNMKDMAAFLPSFPLGLEGKYTKSNQNSLKIASKKSCSMRRHQTFTASDP